MNHVVLYCNILSAGDVDGCTSGNRPVTPAIAWKAVRRKRGQSSTSNTQPSNGNILNVRTSVGTGAASTNDGDQLLQVCTGEGQVGWLLDVHTGPSISEGTSA